MMKKITVAVHERIYHQARVWAAEHDTSLSAVVAYLLETLPGIPRAARAFPSPQSSSRPPDLPTTPAAPSGDQNAARIL
jgi:putative lipase involved disintegration of autophagic bodies